MKCKRSIALLALVLTLVLVPAVITHATPPDDNALGIWGYTPFIKDMRFADGNTFMEAYTADPSPDIWTGTFEGTSEDVYKAKIHSKGAWSCNGLVFFTGKVGDKTGTLVIRFSGWRPDEFALWSGKWVILHGTGDLANLRGKGTWGGEGAPAPFTYGEVWYSGRIYFSPS